MRNVHMEIILSVCIFLQIVFLNQSTKVKYVSKINIGIKSVSLRI